MPYTPIQPGVIAAPGSDLYNQRVQANLSAGVPKNVAYGQGGGWGVDTGLASSVNQFMTGQASLPYQMNLPGYQEMIGKQSENILSQLQGEVPQDVINQIITQAAERGIMSGSPGGQASQSSYLRALGLTSLGLQQQGADNLSRVRADTPAPELFNPMSIYVPERLAKLELNQAKIGATPGGGTTAWNSPASPMYKGTPPWMIPSSWG